MVLPYGVLQFRSLIESGITRVKYPLLYQIIFDWHASVLVVLLSVWFVWMTMRINPRFARF
jgi:hypothetical protein